MPHDFNIENKVIKDKYDEFIDTYNGDGYLRLRQYLISIGRKRRDIRSSTESIV